MQISSRMGKKSRFSSASAPANVVRDVSVLWPLNAVSVISPKAHPKRDILHRVCLIKFAPNKCNAMCDVRASNASVRTDTINPLFSLFLTFPSSFCLSELSTMNEIFLCRPLYSDCWRLTLANKPFRTFFVHLFPTSRGHISICLALPCIHSLRYVCVCARFVKWMLSSRREAFYLSSYVQPAHSFIHYTLISMSKNLLERQSLVNGCDDTQQEMSFERTQQEVQNSRE